MPLKQYPTRRENNLSENGLNQDLGRIRFTVAIAAGKGGVGKSTLCANLAMALSLRGQKVGLLDADIYGPSQRRMIREQRLPFDKGDHFEPALAQGIRLLSMAHFRDENIAGAFRAPIANKLLDQFCSHMVWGEIDFLLIDLPPGTGDIPLTLAQKGIIKTSILISTPQKVATQDVRKCIDLFEHVGVPILGLVENMAYIEVGGQKTYPFGQEGVKTLAQEKGYPLLGRMAVCQELALCCDEGTPYVLKYPQTDIGKMFLHLADILIKSSQEEEKSKKNGCEPQGYTWGQL